MGSSSSLGGLTYLPEGGELLPAGDEAAAPGDAVALAGDLGPLNDCLCAGNR
jgi:hypothetical protein